MVICRSDHSQGQHGGQVIATSYTMFKVATFTDVTILNFDFAAGCLVQLDSFILLEVVICFPPSGSRYLVNRVQMYLSLLKSFIAIHTTVENYDICIIGDFNRPLQSLSERR